MTVDSPTVFVIDADLSFRELICSTVEAVGMVGIPFETPRDFLASRPAGRPNCALVNMRLPGMGGALLQRELLAIRCSIPIIMIADVAGDVESAVTAMKNGAFDYLEKPIGTQQMLDRIQACQVADRELRWMQEKYNALKVKYDSLTGREREVMDCTVHGLNNREMGEELEISIKTVEAHRAAVMRKMGAKSLIELANFARTIEFDPFARQSLRYDI